MIIWWKFWQNLWSLSWFIAKLRTWHWNLTFDLGSRSTKLHFFISTIDYMVKSSKKSVKPFMIYNKIKNLTSKIDLGAKVNKFYLFEQFVLLIIWWKFRQNWSCRSWFIAKLRIWPRSLTLESRSTNYYFLNNLFYWLYDENFDKIGQAVHDL